MFCTGIHLKLYGDAFIFIREKVAFGMDTYRQAGLGCVKNQNQNQNQIQIHNKSEFSCDQINTLKIN